MTNEITRKQKCILLRNGVEIWVDEETAIEFECDWVSQQVHGAVSIGGRTINTVDVSGVFLPEDLDVVKRQKRGQWQCKQGKWHERNEECSCDIYRTDEKGIEWKFSKGLGWIRLTPREEVFVKNPELDSIRKTLTNKFKA